MLKMRSDWNRLVRAGIVMAGFAPCAFAAAPTFPTPLECCADGAQRDVLAKLTGSGLTVIANAPNPAGQSLLQDHFGDEGVSAVKLFLAALFPTVVMVLAFLFL